MIFYEFDQNKYLVEREILKVIYQDSAFMVPAKWRGYDEGDTREMMYLYFKNPPEEIYQIGFTHDTTIWKIAPQCTLGLISKFDGDSWKYDKNLETKEIDRITLRFEAEFLSKLKYKSFRSR